MSNTKGNRGGAAKAAPSPQEQAVQELLRLKQELPLHSDEILKQMGGLVSFTFDTEGIEDFVQTQFTVLRGYIVSCIQNDDIDIKNYVVEVDNTLHTIQQNVSLNITLFMLYKTRLAKTEVTRVLDMVDEAFAAKLP